MKCEGNFELVSAFLDGELTENERADAAEHIKECPACQKILDDFTLMGEMIKGEEVSAPEGLHAAVMEQVAFRQSKKKIGNIKRYGYLVAACVLIVIAGITHFSGAGSNVASDSAASVKSSQTSGAEAYYSYSASDSASAAPVAPEAPAAPAAPTQDALADTPSASAEGTPSDDAFAPDAGSDEDPYVVPDAQLDEKELLYSNTAYLAFENGDATQNALVRDLAAAEKAVSAGPDDWYLTEEDGRPALVVSAEAYNTFVYSTSNCISLDKAAEGWVILSEEN